MAYSHIAFYRFVRIEDLEDLRARFRAKCEELELGGTILLSIEGINGALCGEPEKIQAFLGYLEEDSRFQKMRVRKTLAQDPAFWRLRIRIKREIISVGLPDAETELKGGNRLLPHELKRWLDEGKDMLLVDTRNDYEIAEGTFRGAVDYGVTKFRDFPSKLEQVRKDSRGRPIVMFCTGGIRCEKATALAKAAGMTDVHQLDGGILAYLAEMGTEHYQGKCFVFDERRSLGTDEIAPVSS